MNTVNLLGRIAKAPETRSLTNATVTTVIVATDRVKLQDGKTFKDPETGYTAKETEFHKVTLFGGLGKSVADHKNKGDTIAIEGRLHYTRWQDEAGNERYGCEIIGEKAHFC